MKQFCFCALLMMAAAAPEPRQEQEQEQEQEVMCYNEIVFSRTGLSPGTRFTITPREISFYDPVDRFRATLPFGTVIHYIKVTDTKGKKGKVICKSIIIKPILPRCPLSGLVYCIPEKKAFKPSNVPIGCEFQVGWALNQFIILKSEHTKFELHPVYYACIGETKYHNIYLTIPVEDQRMMGQDRSDELMPIIANRDIVDLIAKHYFNINKFNYKFVMDSKMNAAIQPDIYYHPAALAQFFHQGKLNLAIANKFLGNNDFIPYYCDIVVLDERSYNHIYTNGRESHLKHIFLTCSAMLDARQEFIEKFLS